MVFLCILHIVPCCVLVDGREGLIANGIPMYIAYSSMLCPCIEYHDLQHLDVLETKKNDKITKIIIGNWKSCFGFASRNQWYEPAIIS